MKLKTQPTIFTILQRDKSANAELLDFLELNETTLFYEGLQRLERAARSSRSRTKVIKKLLQQPQ